MRFEWFFIGYLFMMQIPLGEFTVFPLLGYIIMLFAMQRLARYESAFKKARNILFAAVPVGALLFALQFYAQTGGVIDGFYYVLYNIVRWTSEIAEMSVMFFVYIGVKAMGVKAEFPALERHSSRNMSVMFVYLAFEVLVTVLNVTAPQVFAGFEEIVLYPFGVGLIWRILNLWMIITCYLGIAKDDEETKPEENKKGKTKSAKAQDGEVLHTSSQQASTFRGTQGSGATHKGTQSASSRGKGAKNKKKRK